MSVSGDPDKTSTRQVAMDSLKDFALEEAQRLEEQATRAASKEKRKILKVIIQWAVVVVCLGIIGYQLPKLTASLNPGGKPLRRGAMDTDARTDQCIANLWIASKRIQQGRPVGSDLLCPASGKPFAVEKAGDDVIVRSPKPELYGFRELRVSRNNPVPKLIK